MSETLPEPENQTLPAAEAALPAEAPEGNPEATKAFYLGIASIIPILGIALGFCAISLGVKGLKRANQQAVPVGRLQAWIGIMGGAFLAFGQITTGAVILAIRTGAFD